MLRTVLALIPALSFCALVCTSAQAAAASRAACVGPDCAKCHSLSTKEASELLRSLNVTVQSIKHAPIQGMFEVLAQRADQQGIIYVDYAKKHIMQGVIVDVASMEAIPAH